MDQNSGMDFSNLPGWMPAASMGVGGLSDLFAIIQNQRAAGRQRDLYSLLQNPQALASNINQMYQPLSQAGQQSVSRSVQGEMAMRGTADSRYADLASARAFSEVESQRRGQIMDAYMNALGQSAGLTGQRAPIGGLGNALQQVMLMRGMQSGQQPQGIAQSPNPQDAGAAYGNMKYWSTPPDQSMSQGSIPYYSQGQ